SQQLHLETANQAHTNATATADNTSSATQQSMAEIDQTLASSNLTQQQLDQTLVFNTTQLQMQNLLLQVTTNQNAQNLNVLTGAVPILGTVVTFPVTPIVGCVVDPPSQ